MRRLTALLSTAALAVSLLATAPGAAVAHELDHPAQGIGPSAPLSTGFNAGGDQADWQLLTTIATGNPHSDLDFFTQEGDTYASVGTLAIGANAGGQTIIQLTDDGEIAPSFVAGHGSAACPSDPANALGLQHDVEASPKGVGEMLLNTDWGDQAVTGDAQVLVDATDAEGRCHDGGPLAGLGDFPVDNDVVPQGGLEVIDVTDPANPVEIGLTSHIGESHTVNVDPGRPHIVYSVTSDAVGVDADGNRANEQSGLGLDGFEIVDISSCLETPHGELEAGLTPEEKREQCRPEVFRYRYPDVNMALGHTNTGSIYGCHELEVHPNDVLTCAGGAAMLALDMSDVFADTDDDGRDEVQGEPLPCRDRASTSGPAFTTGANITDCVIGADDVDLSVSGWQEIGAPSVEGVEWLGSAYHMGREALVNSAVDPAYPSTEDIDFDHEAELTHSGEFVIATDERGGGVAPGGASCSPGADLEQGNGGVHAYAVDRLKTQRPETAEEAWESYARTPDDEKAIVRAPINTQPQGTECTAHVFQQIPGQNRIFMGWYSQGTQVFDYVEGDDGSFEWRHVGYFTPEYANEWVSHVFHMEDNEDGTFTYYGVAGDFNVGNGRGAIDIYQVTLPAPAQFAGGTTPDDGDDGRPDERPECDEDRPGNRPPHCDEDGEDGQRPECDDARPGDRPERCDGDDVAAGSTGGPTGGSGGAATAASASQASQTEVIDLREDVALAGAPAHSDPSAAQSAALLGGLALLLLGLLGRRRVRAG